MSADNYIKHIAEAAYKNTVKNKSHTDNNLTWYEEPETVTPRVDAKAIWLDSEHIPEDPTKVTFRGNIYFKTINNSSVGIVEKFENEQVSKVNDRAVFYSKALVDVIQNENYHLTIKDAAGDIVPFGLKKWTVDSGVGYLSFTDGMPEGYELPFSVTGYRYCGRELPEHMVTTDGSQQMLPDYVPTEDQSVATKSYVDQELGKLNVDVDKMLPPKPGTFEGKDITFICDDKFDGIDIVTLEHYDNIVLPHYEWTLDVPEFHNPGFGRVSLLVNTGDSWQEFAYIELDKPGKSVVTGGITIDYDGDAYANTLASRGFFNSMKIHFTSSFDNLSGLFKSHTAPMRFLARYQYFDVMYYSNELVVCEEPEQEEMNHRDGQAMVLNSTDMKYRHVSGIITPTAESTLNLSAVKYNVLKKYCKKGHIIHKLINDSQDYASIKIEQTPYEKYSPLLEVTEKIPILPNKYTENFNLKIETFDIFGNLNGELENTYNFRIDTISDESNRVKSGNVYKNTIEGACLEWDPTEDLRENNELQLLGGIYRWPEIDHSVNGNGNLINGTWSNTAWLRTGLDYSKCPKTGVRYVTFKHDMSIANGVYVSFVDAENLLQNKDTHAFNVDSMYIKVKGSTDWLDAKEPYDGIGINNGWMQGCLAVQDSKDGKIYCTFGPKPLEGTLYVRIGITYNSHTRFKGIIVEENI